MGDRPTPPGQPGVPTTPAATPAHPAGAALSSLPPPGAAPVTPEVRAKAVKAFFASLRKGVRQLAMTPDDLARRTALAQALAEPLALALGTGALAVSVEPSAFAFEHEEVWASEGTDDTPGHFHRSGVRALWFQPGFGAAQLDRLLGLLLARPDRGGEDYATQLFNAALPHLSVDFSQSYALGGLAESQVDLEIHRLVADLERRHAAASPDLRGRVEALCQGLDRKLEALEKPGASHLVQGQVTAAFKDRALQDCALDDTRRLAPQLIALAVGQIRSGALSDPARACDLLARLVDAMLAHGNLSPLGTLLDALQALPAPQGAAILQALSVRLAEEGRLRLLAGLLNAAHPDYASLARYLAECKSTAAIPLLGVLPGLEHPHARLLVLEAVAGLDKEAGSLLADRLDVEGGAVVPDLLSLVERLPANERGKLFDRAIHHPAPEVRVAALRAVVGTSIPEAMHRFVLDATKDPDHRIRAAAWRTMVVLWPARAAQDLVRLSRLPDWDKRTLQEKELIFECLGRTESDEAFSYLASLLQVPKKGLFGGKRVELKLLSIHALANMPVLQSFKLLQAVGTMPDQDPEATASAQKTAEAVKQALLGKGAQDRPKAGPEPLPEEVAQALELLKKRLAARAPAPQTAPPPVAPPPQPAAATTGGPDPLLEFPDALAPAPPWATPPGKKRGGGR